MDSAHLGRREKARLAFDDYVRRLDSGEAASPEQLLAAHPSIAHLLRPLLAAMQAAEQAAKHTTEDPFAPGRVVEDYKIVRELGRGGMGVVLLAEQQSLRRRVALKILPPSFGREAHRIERFHRECAAI